MEKSCREQKIVASQKKLQNSQENGLQSVWRSMKEAISRVCSELILRTGVTDKQEKAWRSTYFRWRHTAAQQRGHSCVSDKSQKQPICASKQNFRTLFMSATKIFRSVIIIYGKYASIIQSLLDN